MSKWPGKFIIGLTGNIATGKSVVRKMLEHLGAYGIDADALAHRAIARGAPGYQPVLDAFGRWLLTPEQEIDRSRLGRVVFSDPEALALLEAIVHPLVGQAIDIIVQRARQPAIVIEAIKLLESGLAKDCDSLWVSYASPEVQLKRLTQNRKLSEAEALMRIRSQPAQEQKMAAAQVVIRNVSTFEDTWRQVLAAWNKTIPSLGDTTPIKASPVQRGQLRVQRGRPGDSGRIAGFINHIAQGRRGLRQEDVMAAFGEKAFLLLQLDSQLVGVAGWQVENLVARTTDVYIDPHLSPNHALSALINEVESSSRDLQCEVSLLFLPAELASYEVILKHLGYERRTAITLGVQAWQEAAKESMPDGNALLLFKQLRSDRILRPI